LLGERKSRELRQKGGEKPKRGKCFRGWGPFRQGEGQCVGKGGKKAFNDQTKVEEKGPKSVFFGEGKKKRQRKSVESTYLFLEKGNRVVPQRGKALEEREPSSPRQEKVLSSGGEGMKECIFFWGKIIYQEKRGIQCSTSVKNLY